MGPCAAGGRMKTICTEEIEAARETLGKLFFAIEHSPNMPVSRIFDCACMGPLPECSCAKRSRLVEQFMEDK